MDDDRILLDWLRHYGTLILLAFAVGVGASATLLVLSPPRHEAWTLVAREGTRVSDRELGLMAQAIFRSERVYGPAMEAAGIETTPDRFLEEHAELRPVPDTNLITVVGRSTNSEEASAISSVLADELVEVFTEDRLATLVVVGPTAPRPTRLSTPVFVALGAIVGFWSGLAVAILHFRFRRPLLSLQRAVRIMSPADVVLVRGRAPRWLGVLRPGPRWRNDTRTQQALAAVRRGKRPAIVVAGGDERDDEHVSRLLASAGGSRGESTVNGDDPLVVAHAGTSERGLRRARAETHGLAADGAVDLLWVA